MKTIGLIPLDSRPCNTLWLEQLSEIAGYRLLMYPRNKCGDLFKAADFSDQMNWLSENVLTMDYLIISFDGLTSGGLVQTRTGNANLEIVLENINKLKNFKQLVPKLKIYVFDVLMRTSITTFSSETAKYWNLVNEFSRLSGEIYFNNLEEDKRSLEEVKKELPEEVLTTYLAARTKKHEINKLAINLIKNKLIDYLIILQEDAVPNGIQKVEQQILLNLIKDNNLQAQIKFFNGTDEGALLLFAKAIILDQELKPYIYLHLPLKDALKKVILFEDRPFEENLKLMFDVIGFKFSSVLEADFVLSIYTEKENKNLDLNTSKRFLPNKDENFYIYVNDLNQIIQKMPTCFIDLLFPNGGSCDVLREIDYKNLKAYSAWNTASNSTGSALAHIASILVAKKQNLNYEYKNSLFKKERILDDCLYQYIVRRIINEKALKENLNIYNLGANNDQVLKEIICLLNSAAKEFTDDKFKVSLPWNRTFEAEILIEGE